MPMLLARDNKLLQLDLLGNVKRRVVLLLALKYNDNLTRLENAQASSWLRGCARVIPFRRAFTACHLVVLNDLTWFFIQRLPPACTSVNMMALRRLYVAICNGVLPSCKNRADPRIPRLGQTRIINMTIFNTRYSCSTFFSLCFACSLALRPLRAHRQHLAALPVQPRIEVSAQPTLLRSSNFSSMKNRNVFFPPGRCNLSRIRSVMISCSAIPITSSCFTRSI